MQYGVYGYVNNQRVFKEILVERYDEIKTAKRVFFSGLLIEEKLMLVLDNYHEWECELLKLAHFSILWNSRDHSEAMLQRLTLDRRIANLLAACNLYLDQSNHVISSIFGNPSSELTRVGQVKNELYDSNFGYRFMQALRNHVLHFSLPVDIISFSAGVAGEIKDRISEFTIIPQLKISSLKSNPDFKPTILVELESMKDPFDLRVPTREYIQCFMTLHSRIREIMEPHRTREQNIYMQAIEEFSKMDEGEVFAPRIVAFEAGKVLEEEHLMNDLIDYYDELKKRNSIRYDLTRSFASNNMR